MCSFDFQMAKLSNEIKKTGIVYLFKVVAIKNFIISGSKFYLPE
jgi:hypothetical protein